MLFKIHQIKHILLQFISKILYITKSSLIKLAVNLILLLLFLISLLPRMIINIMIVIFANIAYYVVKQRRHVGLINLKLCFPNMSLKNRQKIIKQHFYELIDSVFAYGLVFFATQEKIKKLVKLKNFHYLTKHYQQRPIILLCPHFVGLDIGIMRLGLEGVVGFSMYSKQSNDYLTKKLYQARIRFIADRCKIFSRSEGLRPIIRGLRETNGLFYYLPDQDVGTKDTIFAPFFAHTHCSTIDALPKIVKLTNALVVPVAIYKTDNYSYELEFFPAWQNYPTENKYYDIIFMNQYIEAAILKALAQYFWLHKKFKTQPNLPRGAIYDAN